MTPRPRTVSDDAVLDATARAISAVGPARLTLADVAAEAGLAPPTLLQRFGSKRGLLLAFAGRAADGVRRTFAEARAGNPSPVGALFSALSAMTGPVETPEALANHLGLLQMDLTDPEFRSHAVAHGEALRKEVADLLAAAVDRGELPRADPERLARAVQAAFGGALIAWAVHREGRAAGAVQEALEVLLGHPAGARPPVLPRCRAPAP